MAETDRNSTLTARQLKFAKLRYEDRLNDDEIAKKCGISDRTVYRWHNNPQIQAEIERLAEADTKQAHLILQRASIKAAQRLEALTEHKTSDAPLAETGRKAACNILESVKLKEAEGTVQINITEEKIEN